MCASVYVCVCVCIHTIYTMYRWRWRSTNSILCIQTLNTTLTKPLMMASHELNIVYTDICVHNIELYVHIWCIHTYTHTPCTGGDRVARILNAADEEGEGDEEGEEDEEEEGVVEGGRAIYIGAERGITNEIPGVGSGAPLVSKPLTLH